MRRKVFRTPFLLFLAALPVAGLFALPAAAKDGSDRGERLYFSGFLGLNMAEKADYDDDLAPARGTIEFDNGLTMAGALGVRLSPEINLEAELSYRTVSVSNLNLSGAGRAEAGGEVQSWTVMLNGIYNFDTPFIVQPFLLGGLGVAFQNGKIENAAPARDVSGDDIGLAWTLGAGLRYDARKGTAFTGSYRYHGTSDIDFDETHFGSSGHELRLGLEYELGKIKVPDFLLKKKRR